MHFLHFITMLLLLCTSKGSTKHDVEKGVIARKITVDQSGHGDFTAVQKAIDSIPPNNNLWTRIYIKAAIYYEKVVIPQGKSFIILQGESRRRTIIRWEEAGSATESSTLILSAENFVAMDISFQNTYNLVIPEGPDGKRILWAPAATLYADKASFYRCGFSGVQDTLTDIQGRHYFKSCYIQGAIDFIWGGGQSVYEKCVINATTGILNGTAGFITAQGRENENDSSGFVFLSCKIAASGPVYLGRAYRAYSRVIFKMAYMPEAVMPQGWLPWNYTGHEEKITFSEVLCSGPGSDTSRRVKWEKNLTQKELNRLVNINKFINTDGWIQEQPRF
ncbi:probable pectinesterase 55 [Ricinus communis]|uniref:probable pectinesterase 55 n=1 Tax=Ricinus communis TaxID=3988 RepID=UPI0007722B35|nr:probable pectinesterase 55 [Ricinus communis]|eukprot:XP_015570382.1 probable pectinesterase 55 [Ricinus communis]